MKKVLLLGDSIRMGYDDYVKEMLDGECEVYYSEDNGRFTVYTLWQANQMFRTHGSFDVVHWNNGSWDMNTEAPMDGSMIPLDEYTYYLRRIARTLKGWGAKVIFATTPPLFETASAVDEQTGANIGYNNELVKTYNAAAKAVMDEEGVLVNDLYELCLQGEKYYKCPDMLHLTEEGYRHCAAQACEYIRKYL